MVAAKFGQSPYDYLFGPNGSMRLHVDDLCYNLIAEVEKQAREKHEQDMKLKQWQRGNKR